MLRSSRFVCLTNLRHLFSSQANRDSIPSRKRSRFIVGPKKRYFLSDSEDFRYKRMKMNEDSSDDEISESAKTTRETMRNKAESLVSRCRHWRYTAWGNRYINASADRRIGIDFTVMSYNILSQDLLIQHPHLYTHCRGDILNWSYRFKNLMNEIALYEPDVICLQEVDQDHYSSFFEPHLTEIGYSGIYKKKTGDYTDGCAIFFKLKSFTLQHSVEVEFNRCDTISTLDRDNIGLIAVLKANDDCPGMKLCVATTHLLFNPKRGDVKLCQLRLFLAEIDKIAYIDSKDGLRVYNPIIFCGDLNIEPNSPFYKFVLCGEIKFDTMLSGNISGQQDGVNKGRVINSECLNLSSLGINQETIYVENTNSVPAAGYQEASCHAETSSDSNANKSTSSEAPLDSGESENATVDTESSKSLSPIPSHIVTQPKMCYLTHPLQFQSVYNYHTGEDNKYFTIKNKNTESIVDYMFYNLRHKRCMKIQGKCIRHDNYFEGDLKLIGIYRLLRSGDTRNIGGLPNAYLSSDHLCLLARFMLMNPKKKT